MKILQILMLLVSLTLLGQDKITPDEKLFNDANSYYEVYNGGDIEQLPSDADRIEIKKPGNEEYCFIKANENFKKIIQDYPLSKYYYDALYYVGHFEYAELKYTESKKHLNELLNANLSNSNYYIRQAYFDLAEIAIYEKDYALAQEYVAKIDTSRPNSYWCGNARERDQNRVNFIVEKLHLTMNKK